MDWEDVRHFLAVADAGTATGAAKLLRASPSTVIKRVGDLEQTLGQQLFERSRDGYALTGFGRAVAERAGSLRVGADDIARLVDGAPSSAGGTVRIATTEMLATYWLAPALHELRALHPEISIELKTGSNLVSLARREADVALRLTRPARGELLARKLADVAFAGYEASQARSTSGPRDWIGFEEAPASTAIGRAVEARLDERAPVLRAPLISMHHQAVRTGIAAALLPRLVGDADPALSRIEEDHPALALGLWLVVHRDLRASPRVRAVRDWLAALATADRARFAGLDL